MRSILAFLILAVFGTELAATPFTIPINQNNSSISVELCVLDECDSDSSNVSGFAVAALDDPEAPTQVTLHDFNFALTSSIDLSITIFLGPIPIGSIDITGSGLSISHPDGFPAVGPAPLVNGMFSLTEVPADLLGTIEYSATGTICVALDGAGLPCDDLINLADFGTQAGDMAGTLMINPNNDFAQLKLDPSISTPLDPMNPDFGTITVAGSVKGSALPPVKGDGDYDQDGDVDLLDLAEFYTCFTGDGGGPIDSACKPGDLDGSTDLDEGDFALLHSLISGPL